STPDASSAKTPRSPVELTLPKLYDVVLQARTPDGESVSGGVYVEIHGKPDVATLTMRIGDDGATGPTDIPLALPAGDVTLTLRPNELLRPDWDQTTTLLETQRTIHVAESPDEQRFTLSLEEGAMLDLKFIDDTTNDPILAVPIYFDQTNSEVRRLPRLPQHHAVRGEFRAPIAARQTYMGVMANYGYELINPITEPVSLVAGETFAYTFRFRPMTVFRWPVRNDDTDQCSAAHQAAAAKLRELGASVSTYITASTDGNKVAAPMTSVQFSETWTGDVADLALLNELDYVASIVVQPHPQVAHLPAETRPLPTVTDAWLKRFSGLSKLQLASLQNANVTGAGIVALCQCRELKQISLFSTTYDGEHIQQLTTLPGLESLSINAPIRASHVAQVGEFPALQYFGISARESLGDGLTTFRADQLITLNCEPASDALLNSLDRFPELAMLHVSGIEVTDQGLKSLAANMRLRLLVLRDTAVTDAGLAALRKLPLHALTLKGKFTDAAIPHLVTMPNLKQLEFEDATISDAAVESLRSSQPTLTVVRTPEERPPTRLFIQP
ncbi:MAG: hypothetical protein KDB23_29795, partial [Planctomycetales bacterium]|nr:hypothetical protein [Planctomycetales bacterium]